MGEALRKASLVCANLWYNKEVLSRVFAMPAINLSDESTHPLVGSWVWGTQGIAYQVVEQRQDDNGAYWLTLSTDRGAIEMPLDRVVGWSEMPPTLDYKIGDKVANTSHLDPPGTIGTVVDLWESEGRQFVTVRQENGILSAATIAWWAAQAC
jgi:hypothetical protein